MPWSLCDRGDPSYRPGLALPRWGPEHNALTAVLQFRKETAFVFPTYHQFLNITQFFFSYFERLQPHSNCAPELASKSSMKKSSNYWLFPCNPVDRCPSAMSLGVNV